jgi:excisionase family DNA binding protein
MVIDLADRTVLPPAEASLTELAAQLAALSSPDGLSLALPDGQAVQLPAAVADALREVVSTLAQGKAIVITARDTTLTTQGAAELLGISRPTLIRLLEAGEIPYQQPGRHRRVQLTDLLAYQDRIRHRRREALAEMAADAADDDAYFTTAGFVDTR